MLVCNCHCFLKSLGPLQSSARCADSPVAEAHTATLSKVTSVLKHQALGRPLRDWAASLLAAAAPLSVRLTGPPLRATLGCTSAACRGAMCCCAFHAFEQQLPAGGGCCSSYALQHVVHCAGCRPSLLQRLAQSRCHRHSSLMAPPTALSGLPTALSGTGQPAGAVEESGCVALQLLAAKGVPSAGEPMHVLNLCAAGAVLGASSTVLTAQMCTQVCVA